MIECATFCLLLFRRSAVPVSPGGPTLFPDWFWTVAAVLILLSFTAFIQVKKRMAKVRALEQEEAQEESRMAG